jgi:hypothetical protein
MSASEKLSRAMRWRREGSGLLSGIRHLRKAGDSDVPSAAGSERPLARGELVETREATIAPTVRRELVSQAELQQDLQRFMAGFSGQISQATQAIMEDASSKLFEPALRHTLHALSSSMDIVAGPVPEVNLLDMVVFVSLSREVFATHDLPNVFGEQGQALARAFARSEEQIWLIARKVLTPEQEQWLRDAVRAWRLQHPEQTRVAGVRFAEFSGLAAALHSRTDASGILAGVLSATRTADAALLLGERGMFLAPRMPYIARLHARLGVYEILHDSLAQLDKVEALVARTSALRPMLSELNELVTRSCSLALETQRTSVAAQALSESAWPLLQGAERLLAPQPGQTEEKNDRLQSLVEASTGLVQKTQTLVHDLNGMTQGDPLAAMNAAATRLEHYGKRLLWQAAAVGAGLIVLFWTGYYLAIHAW